MYTKNLPKTKTAYKAWKSEEVGLAQLQELKKVLINRIVQKEKEVFCRIETYIETINAEAPAVGGYRCSRCYDTGYNVSLNSGEFGGYSIQSCGCGARGPRDGD